MNDYADPNVMLLGEPLVERMHTALVPEDLDTIPTVTGSDSQITTDAAIVAASCGLEWGFDNESLTTLAEFGKLAEHPLLDIDRLTPHWPISKPTAVNKNKASYNYSIMSHYTYLPSKCDTNLLHPVWGFKIPWSKPHVVQIQWSDVIAPSWWEACSRFKLLYDALPRIYACNHPGSSFYDLVAPTYAGFLTTIKSFMLNPVHDKMRPFFGVAANAKGSNAHKPFDEPGLRALHALTTLRHMSAAWACEALTRCDLGNIIQVIKLVNQHLFRTSVYLPHSNEHSQPCFPWYVITHERLSVSPEFCLNIHWITSREYIAHHQIHAARETGGLALPLASGIAGDQLTQATFYLDIISSTLVTHMREWSIAQDEILNALLAECMQPVPVLDMFSI